MSLPFSLISETITRQNEVTRWRDSEELRLMIESAPPLSIYYPPSSHSSFTKLVPTALPPKALSVGRDE